MFGAQLFLGGIAGKNQRDWFLTVEWREWRREPQGRVRRLFVGLSPSAPGSSLSTDHEQPELIRLKALTGIQTRWPQIPRRDAVDLSAQCQSAAAGMFLRFFGFAPGSITLIDYVQRTRNVSHQIQSYDLAVFAYLGRLHGLISIDCENAPEEPRIRV